MEPNLQLRADEGEAIEDVKKYRKWIGSLIYLTISRPTIAAYRYRWSP